MDFCSRPPHGPGKGPAPGAVRTGVAHRRAGPGPGPPRARPLCAPGPPAASCLFPLSRRRRSPPQPRGSDQLALSFLFLSDSAFRCGRPAPSRPEAASAAPGPRKAVASVAETPGRRRGARSALTCRRGARAGPGPGAGKDVRRRTPRPLSARGFQALAELSSETHHPLSSSLQTLGVGWGGYYRLHFPVKETVN